MCCYFECQTREHVQEINQPKCHTLELIVCTVYASVFDREYIMMMSTNNKRDMTLLRSNRHLVSQSFD